MSNSSTAKTSGVSLVILGSGQDAGVPQANCYCDNCKQLRDSDRRRYAAALAVVDSEAGEWHLIDATPDLPEQLHLMHQLHPSLGIMSNVLITHGHIGHYAGLMFLGREVMAAQRVPVWAGRQMQSVLQSHLPWSQLVRLQNISLQQLSHAEKVALGRQIRVTPLEVPHRNEYSETFGFLIEGPNHKALYIPDIDSWHSWKIDVQRMAQQVDYCIVDATFFSACELRKVRGRDIREVPHPAVTETIDLLQPAVDSGTQVVLIHLNHTNPLVCGHSKERAQVESKGFKVAEEGMELEL